MSDPTVLSPELEVAEREIDNAYRNNPLFKCDYATATWNLLAFAEDMMLKPIIDNKKLTPHESKILIDNLLISLKYPIFWLYSSCASNGFYRTIPSYNDKNYQAAWDLMNLAEQYDVFWTVFTYARRGWIELSIDDNEILVHRSEFLKHTEYEAYSRLIGPIVEHPDLDSSELTAMLDSSLKIENERFSYKLNPKIVAITTEKITNPILNTLFSLPNTWQFSRYSLGDFQKVFTAIVTVAYIHLRARVLAAQNGCIGLGIIDSIYIISRGEFKARIGRYSGVDNTNLDAILEDLTYGTQSMRYPDPVLQPLIPLDDNSYAIMPYLWVGNAAERNFTVLLNRLPKEKKIYASLVEEKEELMRSRIKQSLSAYELRFISGHIPQYPKLADIDLAIVDDVQKVCLLAELKWFIDPAEIREILERTKELKKGVSQLLLLKEALIKGFDFFAAKLGIDITYKIQPVLVSANWIGFSNVQSADVPIINVDHFLKKIAEENNLASVADWLSAKRYLPVEGQHYQIVERNAQVGKWKVKWYGIKPLIADSLLRV